MASTVMVFEGENSFTQIFLMSSLTWGTKLWSYEHPKHDKKLHKLIAV